MSEIYAKLISTYGAAGAGAIRRGASCSSLGSLAASFAINSALEREFKTTPSVSNLRTQTLVI